MAEGDTFAISALVRKRAELAGLIELRRAELETMVRFVRVEAVAELTGPSPVAWCRRPRAEPSA